MVKTIQLFRSKSFQKIKSALKYAEKRIESNPLRSFFIFLAVVLALILLSNFITRPKPQQDANEHEARKVQLYHIGSAPQVKVQATVEKSGVITVSALTSGIVQKINVQEGSKVGRGTNLAWISSSYSGATVSSYQREMAARQYNFALDTYQIQKDTIAKQRDVAFKSESTAYDLREITRKSIDETKSLISLNEEIVRSLDDSLKNLESTNTGGVNDSAIATTKQIKSQVLAGLSQARAGLRASEYQVNVDNPPAKLSELQKDITLKTLAIQEKSLDLSMEMSRIQLRMAEIAESLNYPSSPVAGSVQRVFVRSGQLVNPGTPIATISGASSSYVARAFVPASYAQSISRTEPSTIHINKKTSELLPHFISQDAVEGSLYMITYKIPEELARGLADKSIVTVSIPVGSADTTSAQPFIPIDSVYQTADRAYVFVAEDGKAVSKEIETGTAFGSFVEVVAGLGTSDSVILDRTVIDGERVQ